MSAIADALVKVARVFNLVGKIYEDQKVDFKDAPLLFAGLGDLGALGTIDYSGVVNEFGKLSDEIKAEVITAFDATFNLAQDVTELAIEEAVDAALDILLGLVKGKSAFSKLLPKAA